MHSTKGASVDADTGTGAATFDATGATGGAGAAGATGACCGAAGGGVNAAGGGVNAAGGTVVLACGTARAAAPPLGIIKRGGRFAMGNGCELADPAAP